MKKLSVWILAMSVFLSCFSCAFAAAEYGVLKIIANQESAKIYVDGNFEGTGTVSRDKIIIGNHLVQVKDEGKNVLFEEMVSVREGEQTTVFAKVGASIKPETEVITPPELQQPQIAPATTSSQYEFPKTHNVLGLEASYGNWNVSVAGYSSQSPEPVKEFGVYLKTITDNNAFAKSSFHYIMPISGATSNIGSFIALDLGGQSDVFEVSAGLNYLFSNISGTTGGLGYQAFAGLKVANVTIGAKYLILNSSINATYYYSSTPASYSQILLCASVDFGK